PPPPRRFARGPVPRSSSEQFAPTLGSALSFAGTHRPAWHDAPIPHAPLTGETGSMSTVTLRDELTSTSAQPEATTPQSSFFATAANAYFPRARSPSTGVSRSLRLKATRTSAPSGTPACRI